MRVMTCHEEAYGMTLQPIPVYCGENIMLYRKYKTLDSGWKDGLHGAQSTINASATPRGHVQWIGLP